MKKDFKNCLLKFIIKSFFFLDDCALLGFVLTLHTLSKVTVGNDFEPLMCVEQV